MQYHSYLLSEIALALQIKHYGGVTTSYSTPSVTSAAQKIGENVDVEMIVPKINSAAAVVPAVFGNGPPS